MDTVVDLSRLQFAITAMYHFLFVPLTLGMTWLLVIMESMYVKTNNPIYKDMTKFWGKLFGINFAVGVTTGLTMEFQFGTNWAYYSHYVGDIFGAPLAIEGLMAFFLESTFIGLFFFAWNRVSKKQHLLITILVAIGSNLSAFWILVANGWMSNPVGTIFNPITMRMELDSFTSVLTNPYAMYKFFHTIASGYVTASVFVLAISSYYLLKKTNLEFAKKSFKIAAIFGFISSITLVIIGDASGIQVYKHQPSKLAAMEGIWDTEKAPVGWSLFAIPDSKLKTNLYEIKIPYVASMIITHDFTTDLKGSTQIIEENKAKILKGREGLLLLNEIKSINTIDNINNLEQQKKVTDLLNKLDNYKNYLGYGLLLKKYTQDISVINDEILNKAANSSVPNSLPLYFTFRLMVFLGFSFILLFSLALYYSKQNKQESLIQKSWFLKWSLFWLPAPWIAALSGWFVAEYGRQPWTIFEILPTHLSASNLSVREVAWSLTGFIVIYTVLAIIEVWLMKKYVKLGPDVIKQ